MAREPHRVPTFQTISAETDTDLGWGFATIQRHPVTHERVGVTIQCKTCQASTYYDTRPGGGIANAFQHVDGCRVLREVSGAARAFLARSRRARS